MKEYVASNELKAFHLDVCSLVKILGRVVESKARYEAIESAT